MDKTKTTLVKVPLHILQIIQQYYDLQPKEFSKLPTRVRMAISDLTEYIPKEKS